MDKTKFQQLQEHALIALTYIEYDQNTDRAQAEENKQMILDAYDKNAINEGAMLVLAALVTYEAFALDIPLAERIQQIREIVRDGLQPAAENDEGE